MNSFMTPMEAGAANEALPRIVTMCADLVHVHGLSPSNVARRMALPLATVTDHLLTARNARQALAYALTNRASTSVPAASGDVTPPPAPAQVALELVKLVFSPSPPQADMIDLALEGIPPVEIARRVGVQPAYVSSVLRTARSNGVPVVRFLGGGGAKSKPAAATPVPEVVIVVAPPPAADPIPEPSVPEPLVVVVESAADALSCWISG